MRLQRLPRSKPADLCPISAADQKKFINIYVGISISINQMDSMTFINQIYIIIPITLLLRLLPGSAHIAGGPARYVNNVHGRQGMSETLRLCY